MLRRHAALIAGAVITLLAASGTVSAQVGSSLTRAGSGARGAGMADAFVAVSDDGTAASWNPGGLAQLRQPEFSLVYGMSDRGIRLTSMRSADDRRAYAAPFGRVVDASVDFVSAALPFSVERRPVTVQVGWHRLYQLHDEVSGDVYRYPTSNLAVPDGVFSRNTLQNGHIGVYSVAGAVKLTSRLALGAGADFWRGGWHGRNSYMEEPGPDGKPAFLTSRFEQRMRGHTFSLGLLLTYPSWNVGLVHHAPFWSQLRAFGSTSSTQFPTVTQGIPNARFRIPRSVGLGVARRLPQRWMVAAAVTHDEWTKAVVTGIPGLPEVNFFDSLPTELSAVRDTVAASVGVEHLLVVSGAVIPVRLGFGWEPQGAMDPVTRDPIDYHMLSAGIGYNTNRVKLDAAVQYRWDSVRISDVYSVATLVEGGLGRDAIGRASSTEWRIKFSAIYRMTDTDTFKDLFRKIFG